MDTFDEVMDKIMQDQIARTAAVENSLRRDLAKQIRHAMDKRNYILLTLAEQAQVPIVQLRRLLHEEVGGSLALATIVRVADVLDLKVCILVSPM